MQPEAPVQPVPSKGIPALFNPSDNRIAEVKHKLADVLARLPQLVEAEDMAPLKEAMKDIVPLRTAIDKCHKVIKEDALRFGQAVDAEKRRLHGLVREFEDPIAKGIAAIEEAGRKRAEEKVRAEEARIAAEKKAKEDAEAVLREAERQKEEAERAEARRKLDEERAEFERKKKEQDEADRVRREKLDAEERAAAEKKRLLDEEAAKVKAEADKLQREKELAEEKKRLAQEAEEKAKRDADAAIAKAEQDRKDAAEAERKRKEQEEADRKAAEAARPDVEKIKGFGADLQMGVQTMMPEVKVPAAREFMVAVETDLLAIIQRCKNFTFKKAKV